MVGKGKISFTDALNYDIGLLQYLWYQSVKESKNKENDKKKLNSLTDALKEGG